MLADGVCCLSWCSMWVPDTRLSFVRGGGRRLATVLPPDVLPAAAAHAVFVAATPHAHLPQASRYYYTSHPSHTSR